MTLEPGPDQQPAPRDPRLGVLQLCADRRFHALTMRAFENATGLAEDEYWIEAGPGGAPAWAESTRMAGIAYAEGVAHMGWAAHGDACKGFPGVSNDELRRMLKRTVRERSEEFPHATHYGLFATEEGVELLPPGG